MSTNHEPAGTAVPAEPVRALTVDGRALRRLRLLRGRTAAEAARLAAVDGEPGLSRNHWTRIERGGQSVGVRPATARKLARGVATEGAGETEVTAVLKQFATAG